MKRSCPIRCLVLVGLAFVMYVAGSAPGAPAGTAFTYQGRLHDGGSPAAGLYDFTFELYNASTAGSRVGTIVQINHVELVNGHFTATLDFGQVFDGQELWLQIGVRPGDAPGGFITLSPRQRIGTVPYAQRALNDSDILAALQCAPGQVPKFVGGRWTCADDETEAAEPAPAPVEPGNWKVVVGAGQNSRLQAIMRDAARGRPFDGRLIYLDELTEARRIDFFDALPISYEVIDYEVGTSVHLEETLEFKVAAVRLTTTGVSGGMIRKLFSNRFIFEVNGEPVADVLTVQPGAIRFNGPEAALHTELPPLPALPPPPVRAYGFTVSLPVAAEVPDSAWKSVSGGAMEVVLAEEAIAGYRFGDVFLRGNFTHRLEHKNVVDWVSAWAMGEGKGADGEIVFYDMIGSEFLVISYVKVRPVLYRPPAVDAASDMPLEEELTFRAMAIE